MIGPDPVWVEQHREELEKAGLLKPVAEQTEEAHVYGAEARALALSAGYPEWWQVTAWPIP